MASKTREKHRKENTAQAAVDTSEKQPWFLFRLSPKYRLWLLVALAGILYVNTLGFDFALDDRIVITDNTYTKKGLDGIKEILTNDAFTGFFGKEKSLLPGGRYRPLSQVIFAIEYEFFGLSPFVGHLTNILFYILSVCLVYWVLQVFFKNDKREVVRDWLTFLGTALFAAHPLHTEVVANIKGLDENLSLAGFMATILFSLKFHDSRKALYLLAASVSFMLGLLAKENAITVLAVVPLSLIVFRKAKLSDHLIVIFPLLLMVVFYMMLRYNALGFLMRSTQEFELLNNPFLYASPSQKIATILFTWLVYLKLMLFPHPLTHDYYPYHIQLQDWQDGLPVLSLLLFTGLVVYGLARLWKKDIWAFSILFYLATFSISSNLLFNIGSFMNERFVFISLLGFTLPVAYLIMGGVKRKMPEKYPSKTAGLIFLAIIALYSVKTVARNMVWKDDFTLFTSDVKTSKNSSKCTVSAGGALLERSRKEPNPLKKEKMLNLSMKYLKKGLSIHPHYFAGHILLGNVYLELKEYKAAVLSYENCLKMNPKYKDALNNILYVGQNSNKDKRYAAAVIAYKTLLKYNPGDEEYRFQLASNLVDINKTDTAMAILQDIILKNPSHAKAYGKIGEIYGRVFANLDKSFEYLLKSYKLDSTFTPTLENMGIVYGMRKDYKRSLEFFEKALRLEPDNPRIYQNIAGTYALMNEKSKAEEYMAKAEEIRKKKESN